MNFIEFHDILEKIWKNAAKYWDQEIQKSYIHSDDIFEIFPVVVKPPDEEKLRRWNLCNCSSHPHVISRSIINLRILKYLICRCKYWSIYFLCVLLTGKPCYNCDIILFSPLGIQVFCNPGESAIQSMKGLNS